MPGLSTAPHSTKHMGMRTLSAFLFLTLAASVTAAWLVCSRVADGIIADAEAAGLNRMQSGANALMRQTALVLEPLDQIGQLALLSLRVSRLDGGQIHAGVLGMLGDSMQASRLGVSEVRVLDRDGVVWLREGRAHGDDPEGNRGIGFGAPWVGSDGQVVLRRTSVADADGLRVEITLDPEALSTAVATVLPSGLLELAKSYATLVRIGDGRVVARSDMNGHGFAENLRALPARMSDFQRDGFGHMRVFSGISQVDMLMGYQIIPDLGLVAVVSTRAHDVLPVAELRARTWRRAPWALLVVGLLASLAILAWATRRLGWAALEAEKQRAVAAAAARAELDDLLRCSPAFLFRGRLDPQGVFTRVYVTPNTRSITGWEADELGDRVELWKQAPAEDQRRRAKNYLQAHREGRSVIDYRLRQPGGEYCWLRNEVVVILRHSDGSADVVGAVTNVTHEHELAARSALKHRMATLGETATSIAHELSQPVTVITLAASYAQSLVQEIEDADELAQQIDSILVQGRRASEIIRHLRSYGHADGGALGPVDLRMALAGAMVLAGKPMAEAHVAVTVELPVDLPLVQGRLVQVEQVLMNLMINARDAMRTVPPGARRLRITAEVSDNAVNIHMADSGPGMAPAALPRLFEPFFTTKAVGEGTGLGLSLCRSMMEGFGGAISARNGAAGAVFSLRFSRVAGMAPERDVRVA